MQEAQVHLGQSDVLVSPLGLGAWAWGDRVVWRYGHGYGDQDLRAAFDVSLRSGVDFFDTAEVYGRGRSEKFLGRFMREWRARPPASGPNSDRPVIATKFMPFPWRMFGRQLNWALWRSLRRLGLKHVDLYQIHWPFPPVSIVTWMDALADAVDAGLARAVGVSNYSAEETSVAHAALARRGVPLASNQIHYSLLHRKPEWNGVLRSCRELGVTPIAYSPLEMGLLTGKYTPEKPPPGFRAVRYPSDRLARIQPLVHALQRIGQAHAGKTAAQVALNWAICKGTIPIPGAKNAHQAEENAGALGWRLSEAEIQELDALSAAAD